MYLVVTEVRKWDYWFPGTGVTGGCELTRVAKYSWQTKLYPSLFECWPKRAQVSSLLFPLLFLSAQLKWCFIIIWVSEINSSHDYAQKDTVLYSHSLLIRAECNCVGKQQMGRNQSGQTGAGYSHLKDLSSLSRQARPFSPPVTCPAVIGLTA